MPFDDRRAAPESFVTTALRLSGIYLALATAAHLLWPRRYRITT